MSSDYDPNYISKIALFQVGGKVIVINQENKILILQRSDKAGGGGLWSLPGGALEYGEEVSQAAIREVAEETELVITKAIPFAVKTHINGAKDSDIVIGYISKLDRGEVKLNWEHDDYKWLAINDILKLKLTTGARFFIEEYSKYNNNISDTLRNQK